MENSRLLSLFQGEASGYPLNGCHPDQFHGQHRYLPEQFYQPMKEHQQIRGRKPWYVCKYAAGRHTRSGDADTSVPQSV